MRSHVSAAHDVDRPHPRIMKPLIASESLSALEDHLETYYAVPCPVCNGQVMVHMGWCAVMCYSCYVISKVRYSWSTSGMRYIPTLEAPEKTSGAKPPVSAPIYMAAPRALEALMERPIQLRVWQIDYYR